MAGWRVDAVRWRRKARSAHAEIGERPHHGDDLEHRDGVEIVAERLLTGLVPEHRAPRIGAGRAAEEREPQQCRLRNAPLVPLSPRLVDPERRESVEIDHDQRDGDVGGGEEGLGGGDTLGGHKGGEVLHGRVLGRKGLRKGCFWVFVPAPGPMDVPTPSPSGKREGLGVG